MYIIELAVFTTNFIDLHYFPYILINYRSKTVNKIWGVTIILEQPVDYYQRTYKDEKLQVRYWTFPKIL